MDFNYCSIEDIVGKECYYYSEDQEGEFGMQLSNPIMVKILGYYIQVDDKPPYPVDLRFLIEPVGEHNLDEDEIDHLRICGSYAQFLSFENHF
jgi:hypothetical protein